MKRILIAGIGNIFYGDDAFGVEVVRQLAHRDWPEPVDVVDFGIRAYDLAYALSLDYAMVVLVDAVPGGKTPGTVCLIEPDLNHLETLEQAAVDAHSMNPVSVLRMAKSLGGAAEKLFLIGCEPAVLECENGEMSLSKPVQAALPRAVEMIESLVAEFLDQTQPTTAGLVPA